MSDYCVVFVTCANGREAKKIAGELVSSKTAACVNILPGARSVYRWDGRVRESRENVLMIKSRRRLFSRISRIVRKNHSYSCPEIVSLPITEGFPPYLDWIKKNLN